jgi:hypothetical protein
MAGFLARKMVFEIPGKCVGSEANRVVAVIGAEELAAQLL